MENPWKRIPEVAGTTVESKMVEMDDGWSIRVIQWVPENDSGSAPLVMVPGWNSVYEGWQEIVEEWAPRRRLTYIETREKDAAPILVEAPHVDFQAIPSQALLEDAGDSILIGIDNQSSHVQGDLLTIHARVGDLERMVGTILRSHGGSWGEAEKDLLLRLADRRGWPIDEQFVRHRVLMVATNIAEVKGASMASDENTIRAMEDAESTIERIRSKLSSLD